jgi:hypothetical protein
MRCGVRRAWSRGAILLAIATGVALLAAPASGVAADALECTFRGPGYPKLGRHSKPGNLYVAFIKRSLTCDEARAVARRGTKTANPGPFRPFEMAGGWSCVSFSPGFTSKVVAGQCSLPGTRKLVNWSPVCEQSDSACKNLRRPR